jgi:hypothetical protein
MTFFFFFFHTPKSPKKKKFFFLSPQQIYLPFKKKNFLFCYPVLTEKIINNKRFMMTGLSSFMNSKEKNKSN